jgi:HPt (histidine-containing phosphotransfer) domain-containing protein
MPKHARAEHVASDGSPTNGTKAAIDLVHLSRQTLGDAALEAELLRLFDRQAQQLAARLAALPLEDGESPWRAELAHTLMGSARAIGAFDLADAAEAYEKACRMTDGASAAQIKADAWSRLAAALGQARASLALLL